MWKLLAVFRLAGIAATITAGAMISLFAAVIPASIFQKIAQCWYRMMAFFLGLRCSYQSENVNQVVLLVSNHVSWADIIVLGCRWPFVFLSMKAVESWPLIGWLAKQAGTLFIERGKGGQQAVEQIKGELSAGRSVVLFPEGRTTEGVSVKKFHPRIFQAAVDADVSVMPVGIAYYDHEDQKGSPSRIGFSEGGLVGGVLRTISGPPIRATVKGFLPLSPDTGRQALAESSQKLVSQHLETVFKAS